MRMVGANTAPADGRMQPAGRRAPKGRRCTSPGQRPGSNARKCWQGLKGRDTGVSMPQSLARVLIHLIYSTKNRERVLVESIREELHRYTAGILRELGSPALGINSVEDHIHIVFTLGRTRSISEVVEEAKTGSSKWIKTKAPEF